MLFNFISDESYFVQQQKVYKKKFKISDNSKKVQETLFTDWGERMFMKPRAVCVK